jgi:hypothetical protein
MERYLDESAIDAERQEEQSSRQGDISVFALDMLDVLEYSATNNHAVYLQSCVFRSRCI